MHVMLQVVAKNGCHNETQSILSLNWVDIRGILEDKDQEVIHNKLSKTGKIGSCVKISNDLEEVRGQGLQKLACLIGMTKIMQISLIFKLRLPKTVLNAKAKCKR